MFSRSFVTLNIESSDVRFLVVRGRRILSWGSIPLAPGLVKRGFIYDSAGVSSAINTLFLEKKLPRNGTIVSLTGMRSSIRIFSLPKLKSDLLEDAIRHEAEREMPVPLEELYLSRQRLDSKGAAQRYLILGIPRELLDTEVRTLTQAGIRPRVINLKPLALVRTANREEALIIDMEPDTFDLVVISGGIPVIMRTVISRGEGMVFEDRIPQLKDELARTIEFYNSSLPEHPLGPTTPVYLTGLLADDVSACDLVKAAIDSPIEKLAPPGRYPPDFPLGQYAVNIGLARRQSASKKSTVPGGVRLPVVNPNVLPQRYGPQPISPTGILYPVAAMGLIALLFFMYQWRLGGEAQIASIQDEMVSVNRQIDDMREVVVRTAAAIDDTEAEIDRLEQERESILAAVAALLDLGPSNLSWSLQNALDVLPRGVQLTSIDETADQITLVGNTDKKSSVADYVLALERSDLFGTVYATYLSEVDAEPPVIFSIVGDIAATQ